MVSEGIRVNISYVVQQRNYREMLECWQRISGMGCHSINFQGIVRYSHMTDSWWQENRLQDNLRVDTERLCEQLMELDQAPTIVDLPRRKGLAPVQINGTLRQWIQQRPV